MAVPVITDTSTYTTTSTAPFNMPLPTYAAGDLVVIIGLRNNAGTWTTPSGWNLLITAGPQSGGSARQATFWRIMDGSEGSSVSMTSSTTTSQRHACIAMTIQGFDATLNPPIQAATANTGNSNSPDPPSLAMSGLTGSPEILYFYDIFNVGAGYTTEPTDYSSVVSASMSLGCVHLLVDRDTGTTSQTEDPGSHTMTASQGWVTVTYGVPEGQPKTLSLTIPTTLTMNVPALKESDLYTAFTAQLTLSTALSGVVGIGGQVSGAALNIEAVLDVLVSGAGGLSRLFPSDRGRQFPTAAGRTFPR